MLLEIKENKCSLRVEQLRHPAQTLVVYTFFVNFFIKGSWGANTSPLPFSGMTNKKITYFWCIFLNLYLVLY